MISALRTLETRQFFSASFANSANLASSRLGTLARSVKAERLILNPLPSGSSSLCTRNCENYQVKTGVKHN